MPSEAKRGRPREADPVRIARVALALFEKKGIERVTMDQIARAARVSRSTLFRLYPSKHDLVWDGLSPVVALLQERAAELGPHAASPEEVVSKVFLPVLRTSDAALARRRLRLIASSPGVLSHPLIAEVQTIITGCLDAHPLVAQALVAVAFSALFWWAQHAPAEMSPLEAVEIAFSHRRGD